MGQPLIDKSVEAFADDGTQTVFAISPFGASEARSERLDRLVQLGVVSLDCPSCQELINHPTLNAFAPRHAASARCRSGRRNHCTCDTCF